jgi:hypothetical protein
MDLADFVNQAGIEENALGRSRLPGVDMGGNTNIARPLEPIRPIRRVFL